MCGISGIFQPQAIDEATKATVRRMAATINHRGPDAEGYYNDENIALGHKRLSIIDPSDNGRQPMGTADGRYWIVFNGEIYNYLDLRQTLIQKGCPIQSYTDTEVLLYLYQEHQEQCLDLLNGMFAFAIYDRKEGTLFAARDHYGIKPFYYYSEAGLFAFASEIKALFQHPKIKPEINPDGMEDYLAFQFCLGAKTMFKNIIKLEPGHYLKADGRGQITVRRYWDLDYTIDGEHTAEYFESRLLRFTEDAVHLQMRADARVGAHLSGGLDSSTVYSLASSISAHPMDAFTGAFKDYERFDESAYARLVVEKHKGIHHLAYPDEQQFVDEMPKLIYHMDEPAAGPGLFPQFAVSKLAQQNVKVVLGGQGGDELFGGYQRYLIAYLEACIKGGIDGSMKDNSDFVVTFKSILPNLTQLQGYEPLMKKFWAEGLFEDPARRYFRLIDRSKGIRELISPDVLPGSNGYRAIDGFMEQFESPNVGSYINQMTRFDLKTLLPALLHVEDRVSMAVSLESRVPLLDHRIGELVASAPPSIKFQGGRSKHLFRQIVRQVIPEEIFNRTDKMGFPVPLNYWYQRDPVKGFVRETLLGERSRARGIIDTDQLEKTLGGEAAYDRRIWGMLCLELWFQSYLDA